MMSAARIPSMLPTLPAHRCTLPPPPGISSHNLCRLCTVFEPRTLTPFLPIPMGSLLVTARDLFAAKGRGVANTPAVSERRGSEASTLVGEHSSVQAVDTATAATVPAPVPVPAPVYAPRRPYMGSIQPRPARQPDQTKPAAVPVPNRNDIPAPRIIPAQRIPARRTRARTPKLYLEDWEPSPTNWPAFSAPNPADKHRRPLPHPTAPSAGSIPVPKDIWHPDEDPLPLPAKPFQPHVPTAAELVEFVFGARGRPLPWRPNHTGVHLEEPRAIRPTVLHEANVAMLEDMAGAMLEADARLDKYPRDLGRRDMSLQRSVSFQTYMSDGDEYQDEYREQRYHGHVPRIEHQEHLHAASWPQRGYDYTMHRSISDQVPVSPAPAVGYSDPRYNPYAAPSSYQPAQHYPAPPPRTYSPRTQNLLSLLKRSPPPPSSLRGVFIPQVLQDTVYVPRRAPSHWDVYIPQVREDTSYAPRLARLAPNYREPRTPRDEQARLQTQRYEEDFSPFRSSPEWFPMWPPAEAPVRAR